MRKKHARLKYFSGQLEIALWLVVKCRFASLIAINTDQICNITAVPRQLTIVPHKLQWEHAWSGFPTQVLADGSFLSPAGTVSWICWSWINHSWNSLSLYCFPLAHLLAQKVPVDYLWPMVTIPSIHTIQPVRHTALNELNRSQIEPSQPPMTKGGGTFYLCSRWSLIWKDLYTY